jgi:hypothetical protein
MKPRSLIVEWARTVTAHGVHVSTQFDPSRDLPQVVVTLALLSVPTLSDRRGDPSLRSIDVAIVAFGAGGDRPDFDAAYDALAPIVDAAGQLYAERWMSGAGPILVNANNVVVSHATDPDTNCATVTLSATITAIDLPAGS